LADNDGKPHTKISMQNALYILFGWAKKMILSEHKELMGDLIKDIKTISNWRKQLRRVCLMAFGNAEPMGGPGEVFKLFIINLFDVFLILNRYLTQKLILIIGSSS